MRRIGWWALVIGLSAAIVAAACLGAWQSVKKTREPEPVAAPVQIAAADDPAARQAVLDVATTNVPKLLSYSPATLEQDVAAAKKVLTGEFLEYYTQFTDTLLAAARDQQVTSTAIVTAAGVESLTTDTASIVVFVTKTTTSPSQAPTDAPAQVRVSMKKVDDEWLIEKFEPL